MTLAPFRINGFVLAAALAALIAAAGSRASEPASIVDVLGSVVGVRSEIPENAHTAGSLGTRREGSGIIIGTDGLVLTIGYLILEASSTEIVGAVQRVVVRYREQRQGNETFLETYRRVGSKPFKESLYATDT